MKRTRQFLFGALAAIAVASCGGGGGGGSLAEGGIGGTGISSGSISAFGSVVVNGTTFDVDAATITVNGDTGATQADLDVGYVVRVDGDLDDGVAGSVRFDAALIGEVDVNGIASGEAIGTLTVMQQTVEITATTVIEGDKSPDAIAADDQVLVSGFRDSTEVLVATHVEVLAATPATDQVIGRVTQTNLFDGFRIGALEVASFEQPDVGDRVLVRGAYDPMVDRFTANTVETVDDLVTTGAEVELEGIVDTFTSPSSLTVDGVPVDAGGAVIVDETGADAGGQLTVDVEVEVEGVFDSAGVLIADRVEIELEDNVEIVAAVAAIDVTSGMESVSFFDPTTGPLVTAAVTAKTRLRDESATPVENFSLADLSVGDWVELDAFEDAAGNVTALKLERIEPEGEVRLEGIVDDLPDSSTVTILGVDLQPVDPSDLTGLAPGDSAEARWSAAAGFMQPMPVDSVEEEN